MLAKRNGKHNNYGKCLLCGISNGTRISGARYQRYTLAPIQVSLITTGKGKRLFEYNRAFNLLY